MKFNLINVSDLKFNNDKLCKVKTVHSAESWESVSSGVTVALAGHLGLDSNTDESPQADTLIGLWPQCGQRLIKPPACHSRYHQLCTGVRSGPEE